MRSWCLLLARLLAPLLEVAVPAEHLCIVLIAGTALGLGDLVIDLGFVAWWGYALLVFLARHRLDVAILTAVLALVLLGVLLLDDLFLLRGECLPGSAPACEHLPTGRTRGVSGRV